MNISVFSKWPILACATLLAASPVSLAAVEYEKHDLTVEDAAGPVKVRMSERWQTPATGMIMSMPSVASTGVNGNIRMRQFKSMISVAANTTVEILEGPVPGRPMQRVIQERGNAFYDIAPRGDNKLRVEAAYLVAVVKGTQFNVTVDADTTTIALFEGELQVEAPGVGDVVDLIAGQIARIHRDDPHISIIDMVSGETLARGFGEPGSGSSTTGNILASVDPVIDVNGVGTISTASNVVLGLGDLEVATSANLELGGLDLNAGVAASADLGGGEIALGVEAGGIEISADLDLGLDDGIGESLDTLLDGTETTVEAVVEEVIDPLPDLGDLTGI